MPPRPHAAGQLARPPTHPGCPMTVRQRKRPGGPPSPPISSLDVSSPPTQLYCKTLSSCRSTMHVRTARVCPLPPPLISHDDSPAWPLSLSHPLLSLLLLPRAQFLSGLLTKQMTPIYLPLLPACSTAGTQPPKLNFAFHYSRHASSSFFHSMACCHFRPAPLGIDSCAARCLPCNALGTPCVF